MLVGARGREMVVERLQALLETEYRLLIDALREFRADLIGLQPVVAHHQATVEVTARLKGALGVPVVWGGSGPTLDPEHVHQGHFDLVCVGEGEQVIVDPRTIDAGEPLTNVPGVWAKDAAGRSSTTPAGRSSSSRTSPFRLRSGAHPAHQHDQVRRNGSTRRTSATSTSS